ncbi:hypothetical protein ACFU99_43645, partial [Streptomyces sp. NPDC057654]
MSAWLRAGRTGIVAAVAVLATAGMAPSGMGTGAGEGAPVGPAAVVRLSHGGSSVSSVSVSGNGSSVSVSNDGSSVSVSGAGSSVSASSDGSSASATVRGPGGCVRAQVRPGSSWAVVGRSCHAPRPRPPKPGPRPEPPEPRPPEPGPAKPAPPRHPDPTPVPTQPTPPSPPSKSPAPPPSSTPTPRPSGSSAKPTPAHLAQRAYHRSVHKRTAGGQSMVTFALLIMAPA